MSGKFSRSWALIKASAAVLQSNKSLLVFPLLSGLSTLLVTASFLIPVGVLMPAWIATMTGGDHASQVLLRQHLSAGSYLLLFAFYLVQYFVIFFFQTALTGAALMHLRGEPASVSAGLAMARSRWTRILGYALIAATVGQVLRMLQERLGFIGRLVVAFIGLGWTVATFLVVPILASRDVGPVDAVQQSVQLLKSSWGENLIGNVGIGVVFTLFLLLAVPLAVVLIAGAVMTQSMIIIVLALIAVLTGLTLLGLIQSSLHGIYAAALYRYADMGETSAGFNADLLAQAFRVKGR